MGKKLIITLDNSKIKPSFIAASCMDEWIVYTAEFSPDVRNFVTSDSLTYGQAHLFCDMTPFFDRFPTCQQLTE